MTIKHKSILLNNATDKCITKQRYQHVLPSLHT